MSTALLSNRTLLVDHALHSEALDFVDVAHDRAVIRLSAVLNDGTVVDLPSNLANLLGQVLHEMSLGPISVARVPSELTSTTAADVLAVSRPTLMKWVREGILQSRKVGSHHRFDASAVLELAEQRRSSQRRALVDLRELGDALEDSVSD